MYKLTSLLPFPTYVDGPSPQLQEGLHKHFFDENIILAVDKEECLLCTYAKDKGKKAAIDGKLVSDNPYKGGYDSELWLEGFFSIRLINNE